MSMYSMMEELIRTTYACFPFPFLQVHVLPREMLGSSTFGLSMWLLKWFPIQMVDRLLLFVAWLMLGDTARLGLDRPHLGPLQLKNRSGKTPVLDVGTLAKIRAGEIKVRYRVMSYACHFMCDPNACRWVCGCTKRDVG